VAPDSGGCGEEFWKTKSFGNHEFPKGSSLAALLFSHRTDDGGAGIEGFRDVVACVVMSDGVTQLGLNRH